MSKKNWPEMYEGKRAGFVYLATNPAIPGHVKAGRTQGWPDERVKGLYSTGVPEPFVCVDSKFFVDCFTAENAVLRSLAADGTKCNNREFFRIETKLARKILGNHYRTQHEFTESLETFDLEAREAFRRFVVDEQFGNAQRIADCLLCLPCRRRETLLRDMLAISLDLGSEYCAKWLVRERGVDPEVPLVLFDHKQKMDLYYLTGYENAILLRLTEFEQYLERIGCDLDKSCALCWVIDCLINGTNRSEQWSETLVRFAMDLLKRGANVEKVLEVGLFAEAPARDRRHFRYDLFPRNSGLTCREVIQMLALRERCFAALQDAIENSFFG